jgi:hypothetical protein
MSAKLFRQELLLNERTGIGLELWRVALVVVATVILALFQGCDRRLHTQQRGPTFE